LPLRGCRELKSARIMIRVGFENCNNNNFTSHFTIYRTIAHSLLNGLLKTFHWLQLQTVLSNRSRLYEYIYYDDKHSKSLEKDCTLADSGLISNYLSLK